MTLAAPFLILLALFRTPLRSKRINYVSAAKLAAEIQHLFEYIYWIPMASQFVLTSCLSSAITLCATDRCHSICRPASTLTLRNAARNSRRMLFVTG